MKRQKGQVIIEFALVLPLFLMLLFGIIYCGMLFYDYISVTNIARSAAREAAVVQDFTDNKSDIETRYTAKLSSLLTSLYTPEENVTSHTKVILTGVDMDNTDTSDDAVEVTITMRRNSASVLMQMILPEQYIIDYYMRRDPQPVTPTTGE